MKTRGSFIVLLLVLLPASVCTGQSGQTIDLFDIYQVRRAGLSDVESARPLAEKAEGAFRQGRYADARDLYIQALSKATMPDWYFALGQVFFELKDYEQSEESYATAGRLGYRREDFAYYNAACAASLRNAKYPAIYYLELALVRGYRYYNHLLSDPDIDYLRGLSEFRILLRRYFPPERIETDLSALLSSDTGVKMLIVDDLDGDGHNELALLFFFEDSWAGEIGSYYLGYYEKSKSGWSLVNRTSSSLRSTPELNTRGHVHRSMSIDFPSNPTSLPTYELNGKPGSEIIVPSQGLTYFALKVFAVINQQLRELGEVEGFEDIYDHDGRPALVGHYVTDTALLSGRSKTYYWYSVADDALTKHEVLSEPISKDLADKKWRMLESTRSSYYFAELFWFLHENRRGSVDRSAIDRMALLVDPSDKYRNELVSYFKEEISKE